MRWLHVIIMATLLIPVNGKAQCSKGDIPTIAVTKAENSYSREVMINVDVFDQYNQRDKFDHYYVVVHTNRRNQVIRMNCYIDCSCTQPYIVEINPDNVQQ